MFLILKTFSFDDVLTLLGEILCWSTACKEISIRKAGASGFCYRASEFCF